MSEAWSIEIRSRDQQIEFDRLQSALTSVLGLDWLGMAGQPDGAEVAADCAEALWTAGFRLDTGVFCIHGHDGRDPEPCPDCWADREPADEGTSA